MNTAIVFLKAEVAKIAQVAEAVADLPKVTEVYSVTGSVDLIAIIRTRTVDEIAEVVTGELTRVDGITQTETHIAFRAYSTHDLDAAAGRLGISRRTLQRTHALRHERCSYAKIAA